MSPKLTQVIQRLRHFMINSFVTKAETCASLELGPSGVMRGQESPSFFAQNFPNLLSLFFLSRKCKIDRCQTEVGRRGKNWQNGTFGGGKVDWWSNDDIRIHSLAHSLPRMDEKWDGVIVMYPICWGAAPRTDWIRLSKFSPSLLRTKRGIDSVADTLYLSFVTSCKFPPPGLFYTAAWTFHTFS